MKPAALLGNNCTGHGCFPPRPNVQASPTVSINSLGVQRIGDEYMAHCCPNQGCHSGALASGSSSVNIEGLPAGRIGDSVSCGSSVAEGSQNVFIGG